MQCTVGEGVHTGAQRSAMEFLGLVSMALVGTGQLPLSHTPDCVVDGKGFHWVWAWVVCCGSEPRRQWLWVWLWVKEGVNLHSPSEASPLQARPLQSPGRRWALSPFSLALCPAHSSPNGFVCLFVCLNGFLYLLFCFVFTSSLLNFKFPHPTPIFCFHSLKLEKN